MTKKDKEEMGTKKKKKEREEERMKFYNYIYHNGLCSSFSGILRFGSVSCTGLGDVGLFFVFFRWGAQIFAIKCILPVTVAEQIQSSNIKRFTFVECSS